jgi:hypothetical protein
MHKSTQSDRRPRSWITIMVTVALLAPLFIAAAILSGAISVAAAGSWFFHEPFVKGFKTTLNQPFKAIAFAMLFGVAGSASLSRRK